MQEQVQSVEVSMDHDEPNDLNELTFTDRIRIGGGKTIGTDRIDSNAAFATLSEEVNQLFCHI